MTDRELDALIAEKVVGWTASETPRPSDATEMVPIWLHSDGHFTIQDAWRPSTKIADAWQVVERMRTMPNFSAFRIQQGSEFYHAEWNFYIDGGPRNTGSVSDESAPRAICLAALQALGIESPQPA